MRKNDFLPDEMKPIRVQLGRYIYTLETALKIFKAKYGDDIDDMFVDMPHFKGMYEDTLRKLWTSVPEYTMTDLLMSKMSADEKRNIFTWLPMSTIFVDAEEVKTDQLITKQLKFVNGQWIYVDYVNIYTLVRRKVKDIFPEFREPNVQHVYAVKVKCVTEDKNYYLMLPIDAPFANSKKAKDFNAAAAVAWTCRSPFENPLAMIRQGEVFGVHIGPQTRLRKEPKHLTIQEYASLMKMQS